MRTVGLLAGIGLLLAVTGTAGAIAHDRWSSDIPLDGGTITVTGSDVQTGGDWVATRGFQLSLYADEGAGPGNDWYDFNHYQPYDPSHKYYAPEYNTPDYDYYHLVIDTVNHVAESLYTDGPTEEMADWALYYTAHGNIQTVLSGSAENFVDNAGVVTGFLRVEPYASYHAFDYLEGSTPVNAVEIWDDGFLPVDVVGYALTVGSPMTLQPSHVPEPVTMAGLMLGIGCLARYVRKRRG